MRIPNKFNGYSRDGIRLYNDPVTLTALTAAGTTAGTAAAGTAAAGTLAAGAGAAGAGAAGAGLGAAGLGGLTAAGLGTGTMAGTMLGAGGAGLGTTAGLGAAGTLAGAGLGAAEAAAAMPGITTALGGMVAPEAAAALSPEIAANLAAAQGGAGAQAGIMQAAPTAAAPSVTPAVATPPVAAPSGTPAVPNTVSTPFGNMPTSPAEPPPGMVNPVVSPPAPVEPPKPPGFFEGLMQSNAGQAAKTGYDALSSGFESAMNFAQKNPLSTAMALQTVDRYLNKPSDGGGEGEGKRKDMRNFKVSEPTAPVYTPVYKPTSYAVGGPVENMSAMNAVGSNTMYPQSQLQTPMYSNPMVQRPMSNNVISQGIDTPVDRYTGEQKFAGGGIAEFIKKQEKERAKQQEIAEENLERSKSISAKTKPYSRTQATSSPYEAAVKELQALGKKYKIPVAPPAKTSVDIMGEGEELTAARGGIMRGDLGGYSDGGRLLKGPGDGVSDSIPAVIGSKQPARLADGEFVVPARIVSELGNGSTEAGARKLYAMMERVQKSRRKSVGKGKVAVNSKADKHLPA